MKRVVTYALVGLQIRGNMVRPIRSAQGLAIVSVAIAR